ncbi:MAG: hypothetical protein M1813_002184 [Trichoglossum hirsutum]|nr:MAG: hypothetical protein M1813_002184 [Trichoglossum hirsutum]
MSTNSKDTGSYVSPEARKQVNEGLMDPATIRQLSSSGQAAKERRAGAMERRRNAAEAQAREDNGNAEGSGDGGAKGSGVGGELGEGSKQ